MSDLVATREEGELQRLDVVLPGIAENVKNALVDVNQKLISDEEQKRVEAERATAQKKYDCALNNLTAKWFNVKNEAVNGLTPERKKELEELILRKAEEGLNGKRLLHFLYNYYERVWFALLVWIVVTIIGAIIGGGMGFVVGFFGGMFSSIFAVLTADTLFDKHSVPEIHDLLESQKLLNGDKE